ncbi:MAG: ferric reductase-like transmembrane domain-containing protein [Candidatus Niyogibacteria bacterium]|nr:ferric reductase-like transmembrane domain-containing protein [Candidatus Niyogibacteria bacterium]
MKTVKFFAVSFLMSFLLSGAALAAPYDPSTAKDTDLDGLTDQGELQIFHTDPNNPDTDGDGFLDGAEAIVGSDPLDPNDPVSGGAANVAANAPASGAQPAANPWPWYISRAAAIASYCLLSLLIISGIGIQTRLTYKILNPLTAFTLHRHFGIALAIGVFMHIFSLLFDDYIKLTFLDLFVPFYSSFQPLLVALGVIAFYLFLAVIVTSLFMRVKFPHFWHLLHYLTYPTFFLVFLHGTLLGTDSNTVFMTRLYWSTGIAVGIMILYRLYHGWQMRRIRMAKLAAATAIAGIDADRTI